MKTARIMKRVCGAVAVALLFIGCSTELTNDAPEIISVIQDLGIERGGRYTLDLRYVEAFDINGDPLTLIVHGGENYTVQGTTVFPHPSFVGDLFVPVSVSDGKLESPRAFIIISVTETGKLSVFPLQEGFSWGFNDTLFHTNGSVKGVDTSRFEILRPYAESVEGYPFTYEARWVNIDTVEMSYLYAHVPDEGVWQVGVISPRQVHIDPQLRMKYPASKGDVWDFSPILYNITDDKLERDTLVSEMECTGVDLYITVPAGIFKSFEYTYKATVPAETRSRSVRFDGDAGRVNGTSLQRGEDLDDDYEKVVKLYYSPGVGYVEYRQYRNDILIQRKVLREYDVVDKIATGGAL